MATADYAERAKQAAGNWRKFESFGWHAQPDDADQWCIVYTENRDSRLLDKSNSAAIAETMAEFLEGDDCREEHHWHWACGWVDGYAIRVFDSAGNITPAFKAWCDLADSLENYPVLDDEDYSKREYEATLENIQGELHYANRADEYNLPEDAAEQIYRWLSDNNESAVANSDDSGGYPSTEELQEAMDALGWRIVWVVRFNDAGQQAEGYETEDEAADRCLTLATQGIYATYSAE